MNKRLRELTIQAIQDVDVVYEDNPLNEELEKMYIPDMFAERYAKLIIEECVRVVREQANHWGTLSDEATNYHINKAADALEKRFEVET